MGVRDVIHMNHPIGETMQQDPFLAKRVHSDARAVDHSMRMSSVRVPVKERRGTLELKVLARAI